MSTPFVITLFTFSSTRCESGRCRSSDPLIGTGHQRAELGGTLEAAIRHSLRTESADRVIDFDVGQLGRELQPLERAARPQRRCQQSRVRGFRSELRIRAGQLLRLSCLPPLARSITPAAARRHRAVQSGNVGRADVTRLAARREPRMISTSRRPSTSSPRTSCPCSSGC